MTLSDLEILNDNFMLNFHYYDGRFSNYRLRIYCRVCLPELLSRTDFSRTRTRTWGPPSKDEDEDKDLRSEDEDKDSNFRC